MGGKHDAVRWAVGAVSRTTALLLLYASVLMAGGLELRYGANSPERDYEMESSSVSCHEASDCPGILMCVNSVCQCPHSDVSRCKDAMSSMSDGVIIKCQDFTDCLNVNHSECVKGYCKCKKNFRFNITKKMCEFNPYLRQMNFYRPSSQPTNVATGVVDYSGAVKLALGAAIVMLTGVIVALIWNLCRNRSRPSGNQNDQNQGQNSSLPIPRLREPPPRYTDIFSITTPHQGVRFHEKPPSYEEAIREQQRIAAAPAYINLGYTTDSADRMLTESCPAATNTNAACNPSLFCRTGQNENEPSPVGSVRGAAAAAVASVTSIFGNFRRTRSGRPPRYDPESFPSSSPTFLPVPSSDVLEAGLMGVEDENPSPTSIPEITFGPLTLNLEIEERDKEEVNADDNNTSSLNEESDAKVESDDKDNQSVDSGIGSVPTSSVATSLQSNQSPTEPEATAVVQDSLLTNISASMETEVPKPNIPIIVCDAADTDNAVSNADIDNPSDLQNTGVSPANQSTKEENNTSDNLVTKTNSELNKTAEEPQSSSSNISVPRNTPTGSPSKVNPQQIPDVPIVAVHRLIELEETDVSFV